ncbi:MarR family winged helix-turn-helix transcriptional regulator [Dellaglioa algida]|uniref:Transcriptional regulator n=2 Tax=Dellaglioa algida TaxID=105612 RepID=A0A0R1HTJ5_9LACO|nr:MarR family winged helix-turn-helix transcriptional regulator [Dellaglioa algida]KRK46586.1 transcriptional regulator [Dellaglioa algida DSM 15638]MDK1716546.1 MarR family winged helix-turn-helix transcriptional regulator [Dellaglioa algida]MDK1718031.1 MarR family winged helix-turn-helix transcriptional regulator [Dellaglioa algida]MDK1719961.1 MarR family winged helix-turn-helix transcriptional regulator [Dellaglioa algida]MDK1721488.1 MarR family winged helix-turn-helix transcriptional r
MKTSLENLLSIDRQYKMILQRLTKKNNLTISEWQLLKKIAAKFNTQEKLSKETDLDISTLSRQLKRLVEKDMLDKHSIGDDKRQLIYTMTEVGVESSNAVDLGFTELESTIFEKWPEDEQNLLRMLLNRLDKSLTRTDI